MRRILFAGAALLALAACDRAEENTVHSPPAPPPAASFAAYDAPASETAGLMDMNARRARDEGVGGAKTGADGTTSVDQLEAAGTLLAYRYNTGLQMPARNVRATMEAHEAECRAAGPAVCQVLSSSVNENGENYVYANLSLRAAPEWLTTFRGGLEADARAADGRVVSSTVYAEDLTRAITDTEAQLRAKRTLRERLENLLANQSGDVGDLLAVERELARVQAELDSAQSNLEIMRKRVEMSTLDVSYQPTPVALSQSAFAPIGRAFNDFFGVFSEAVAFIIGFIAATLPFAIIAVPFVWLLRRWWRGRRARKAVADT